MRKLLLPLLFCLSLVGGAVGGYVMKAPSAPGTPGSAGEGEDGAEGGSGGEPEAETSHGPSDPDKQASPDAGTDFADLSKQFVIPVVDKDAISSVVVLSVTLEIAAGEGEEIYRLEPKLRDAFLRVLFAHANVGGFSGTFTSARTVASLRDALTESARNVAGPAVRDVLITELMRQET